MFVIRNWQILTQKYSICENLDKSWESDKFTANSKTAPVNSMKSWISTSRSDAVITSREFIYYLAFQIHYTVVCSMTVDLLFVKFLWHWAVWWVQMQGNISLRCFDSDGWATGRDPACKKLGVGICWWRFDWNFARLQAPPVTATSVTLSCNKIDGYVMWG